MRRRAVLAMAATAPAALAVKRAQAASKTTDVIVIGAGLSGLRAAMDLQELGLSVQVVEGRDRIGGRVYSLRQVPGAPEAGGNGFGSGYGRCLDTAEKLGVPLMNGFSRQVMSPLEIVLRNELIAGDRWESAKANILPPAYRGMKPYSVAGALIARTNPLKNPDDWYDKAFAGYDVPIHTLYKREGFSDAQIELAYNINAYYGTSSHDVSLLMAYFNDIWVRGMSAGPPASYSCIGGNQKLPEAMARSLKSEVHLSRRVVGIRSEKGGVEVSCSDGALYRGRFAVCTVPLPVMRFIAFDPPLPELHSKASKTIPYIPVTQVHLLAKSRFWEADGLSPAMWSDGPFGVLMPQRQNEHDTEITSLVAAARGFGAVRLDQYEPADATKQVISAIERVRPAAKGELEAVAFKSWTRDPFAGGDWAIWAPGQVTELNPAVSIPHGRIHFAGEHTARSNRGMEGAQESGERVAQEIASRG